MKLGSSGWLLHHGGALGGCSSSSGSSGAPDTGWLPVDAAGLGCPEVAPGSIPSGKCNEGASCAFAAQSVCPDGILFNGNTFDCSCASETWQCNPTGGPFFSCPDSGVEAGDATSPEVLSVDASAG